MEQNRLTRFIDWLARAFNEVAEELEAAFAAGGRLLAPHAGASADKLHDE